MCLSNWKQNIYKGWTGWTVPFVTKLLLFLWCGPSDTVNEEDIPEIHFPALGDGYAADELQPSLEPGFQMLHSLEQEEQ